MKKWTKTDLKKTAQKALKEEYGFAPALNDIVLLEASGDRTYIYFSVRQNKYTFRSSIDIYGTDENGEQIESLWIGKGTIEKET